MSDDQRFQAAFAAAQEFSCIEAFCASSTEVCTGAHRLEGVFYGDAGYRARQSLTHAGFPSKNVADLADVYWPGNSHSYEDLKRTYVVDRSVGVPFLSTADMLLSRFEEVRLVSKATSSHFSDLMVKPGCILVSRSGTIGNCVVVTEDFRDMFVSDDALQVSAKQPDSMGLLYAFLQSEAGSFLITRNKSGGVVEHIYVRDLESVGVPLLPEALQRELTRLVELSCELRVNANKLIGEAVADVRHQCYLPDIGEFFSKQAMPGHPLTFVHSAQKRLFDDSLRFGERRLDATYHETSAVAVANHILSHDRGRCLGDVLTAVRNSTLRKRNYVDEPEHGVRLIGGKQLMQWRPHGLKYLSKALTRNLENETAERGWTIVSCGGTLGRCQYIHRNFEQWAMSQDVMRIIPDESKVWPGFIYAFLASDYGQIQIHSRGYGSVIPRLRDFQFNSIAIPLPNDKGETIHEKIVAAYESRGDAHDLEDQAFSLFATAIERGRAYTEAEWGSEY